MTRTKWNKTNNGDNYEIEYVSCVKLIALKSDETYITKRYKYRNE